MLTNGFRSDHADGTSRDRTHNEFAAQAARLHKYFDDGTEYVAQDAHGLSGILSRNIEVDKETFKQFIELAQQQQMEEEIIAASQQAADTNRSKSIFGLPMISPDSLFTKIWMLLIVFMDLTYAAFWVPLNVAFCSTDYGDLASGCTRTDLAGGIIYTLHMLLNLSIGVVMTHQYKKKVIMDGPSVVKLYVRHDRFWLDLASVLPFFYLVVIAAGGFGATRWVAIVSLFRLVRMGRLISLTRIVFLDAQRGDDSSRLIKMMGGSQTAYLILVSLGVATIVNLEACLLVLVAEFWGPENSWMASFEWVNLPEASKVYQWYVAVYAAIASNTNTGLAGIKYQSPPEIAVCCFNQLVGMVMFTLIVSVGITFITRVSGYGLAMYKLGLKLTRVQQFLTGHQLPEHVCQLILDFYYGNWLARKEAVQEDAVVHDMPGSLRGMLLLPITTTLVDSCGFLADCSAELQNIIAQALTPVEMAPGVELCREGHTADCCWLLATGSAAATTIQGQRITLQAPCLLGESVMIAHLVPACGDRLWRYQISSSGPNSNTAQLWRLRSRDLQIIHNAYPELAAALLQYTQGRLVYGLMPGIPQGAFAGATDEGWTEIAGRILPLLLHPATPVAFTNAARQQLLQCTDEDGSLPALIELLLQVAELNTLNAHAIMANIIHSVNQDIGLLGSFSNGNGASSQRARSYSQQAISQDLLAKSSSWQHQLSTAMSRNSKLTSNSMDGGVHDHGNSVGEQEMFPEMPQHTALQRSTDRSLTHEGENVKADDDGDDDWNNSASDGRPHPMVNIVLGDSDTQSDAISSANRRGSFEMHRQVNHSVSERARRVNSRPSFGVSMQSAPLTQLHSIDEHPHAATQKHEGVGSVTDYQEGLVVQGTESENIGIGDAVVGRKELCHDDNEQCVQISSQSSIMQHRPFAEQGHGSPVPGQEDEDVVQVVSTDHSK